MSDPKSPPPAPLTADMPAAPRQRGRPVGSTRVSEPRTQAAVWLPASLYDKLIKHAAHEEQTISATIRNLLILKL